MIGHEILGKLLFFHGSNVTEVRLVIGITACHQFDVRTVFIGKVTVPGFAEVTAAPCPLLLSGRNMVVSYVQDTGAYTFIVTAYKIKVRSGSHIRGWNRQIAVSGNIYAPRIIHFIVGACGNWEGRNISFAMVHNRSYIGRKDGAVSITYGNGRVGPPEEGLLGVCSVKETVLQFQICLIGI